MDDSTANADVVLHQATEAFAALGAQPWLEQIDAIGGARAAAT